MEYQTATEATIDNREKQKKSKLAKQIRKHIALAVRNTLLDVWKMEREWRESDAR